MMKNKGILIGIAIGFFCLLAAVFAITAPIDRDMLSAQEMQPLFRTRGDALEIRRGEQWEPFELVGVNIGTGYPGLYPNEYGIEEDTYLRWFEQISEMNANTVRVYKLQSPEFYSALLKYNSTHSDKLYLIQGVDFDNSLMYTEDNLLDPVVVQPLMELTDQTVDALHGDCIYMDLKSRSLHLYTDDVSDYVLGYLLGVEWDELCVEYTCRLNPGPHSYTGTYLQCGPEANAFELFLAQWGDHLLGYEEGRYGSQRLLTWGNWPETDPLINELNLTEERPGAQERIESTVDIEHIRATENTRAGLFASYNVYPYFPAFLQYGPYADPRVPGRDRGPYFNYLRALTDHHTYPVVITEYGVPASRSLSYADVWRQINHGGMSEAEQGRGLVALYRDIRDAGCAGSIVFTWQDEWYKTMWNEKLLSDPDRRAYWSNAQCAEQFFGLLSFDPGDGSRSFYPDGDASEWTEEDLIIEQDDIRLSMYSDEKYVYFLLDGIDPDLDPPVNLVLDVTPKSGSTEIHHTDLERPADFILRFTAKNSTLYVDEAWDMMPYSALGGYTNLSVRRIKSITERSRGVIETMPDVHRFLTVSRASGNIYSRLAATWDVVPAGSLLEGNANPASPSFSSNADYCFGSDFIEARIPWQLLNFTDPSACTIVDDLEENEGQIEMLRISEIYAAVYRDGTDVVEGFGVYPLKHWKIPAFHERLKQSYYILQEEFKGAGKP